MCVCVCVCVCARFVCVCVCVSVRGPWWPPCGAVMTPLRTPPPSSIRLAFMPPAYMAAPRSIGRAVPPCWFVPHGTRPASWMTTYRWMTGSVATGLPRPPSHLLRPRPRRPLPAMTRWPNLGRRSPAVGLRPRPLGGGCTAPMQLPGAPVAPTRKPRLGRSWPPWVHSLKGPCSSPSPRRLLPVSGLSRVT